MHRFPRIARSQMARRIRSAERIKSSVSYSDDVSQDLLDAGKRASDFVNNYLTLQEPWEIRNCFLAFKLADGSTDGVLYDTKRDAARHQKGNEQQYYYFCFRNCLGGTNPREMAIVLKFARDAYRNPKFRLVDPDDQFGGKQVLMTSARYDADYRTLRNVVDFLKREVAFHSIRKAVKRK